jgi:hypothetical protein
VVLERWARLPEPAESALEAEARDVRRYLAAGPEPDGPDHALTELARADDAGSAGGTP